MQVSTPLPRRYKYFQSAVLDPYTKFPTEQQQTYTSAVAASVQPSPPTGALKITVGVDPASQRTWYLPKALLVRHSTYFAEICESPFRDTDSLNDVDIRAFANFVDYVRSSIYSLNEQIPGFRRIHEDIKACLLGQKLGAKAYVNAAIRDLHMGFEPLANLMSSNMRLSMIRASDVEFVCCNTSDDDDGRRLRQLFFDAIASHWSVWEINKLTGNHYEHANEWTELYAKYRDFRLTLVASKRTSDAYRKNLLKKVQHYLTAENPVVKQETLDETGTKSIGVIAIGDHRPIANPKSIIAALKRRGSGDQRQRERVVGHGETKSQIEGEEIDDDRVSLDKDRTEMHAEIKREE